jgi:hypothetical protein
LKFRIITKLRHAENLGPNIKDGLVNESKIIYSPIHTREEACMGTSRMLGGCNTISTAIATLMKLRQSIVEHLVRTTYKIGRPCHTIAF